MATPSICVHQAGPSYLGRLTIPANTKASGSAVTAAPQTFFILDRSGSMGQNVARLANIVIPSVCRNHLKLGPDDVITIITFDSNTQVFMATVSDFEKADIKSRGTTNMAGVFKALLDSVDEANPNIRICAISDGCIGDTDKTLKAAASAASALKGTYSVSAVAIRLFTSFAQPDTRALASILQLNTSTPGSILDLRTNANDLTALVSSIGKVMEVAVGPSHELSAASECFLTLPWAPARKTLNINASSNKDSVSTVWLNAPPEMPTFNGKELEVTFGDALTHDTLGVLLEDKIAYFMDQLRVLKVINSGEAKEEMSRIVAYFRDLEASLPPPADLAGLLSDGSLAGRSKYLKASLSRRVKSVVNSMEAIANDERINNLNLAQQADYLRQAGSGQSRTTRGLARRAETSGLDFESTMRAEIIAMAANMDKLADIDDSSHAVSFYSQATTLEGIRYVVDLAKDPATLNNLTAPQMLRLFNVVGLPAVGPVGDFPDPMTYRLESILYGSHVSVADITCALDLGGKLTAPGRKEEIITAVPIFEEPRVQKFLQKHARASLEYICSIGMRRMIAEVPKTYPYTICSGVWKMVEQLDSEKTELRCQLFSQLVFTYENAIKSHYEHILAHVKGPQEPNMSFYLGHNGMTNMIAPIMHLVREDNTALMPRILRAVYSFETYQVMRRLTRNKGGEARQEALDKLLGIDFKSERATPLPARFTREEPIHCSDAAVLQSDLDKYKKELWFVPYGTLLEPYFRAVSESGSDYVAAMQAVPTMSTETISKALELPEGMSLNDFLLYNVVEGLLNGDKGSRIDKNTNKPKLPDLGHAGAGAAMIRKYVARRYEEDYEYRLKQQLGEEQRELEDELIAELLATTDIDVFCTRLSEGMSRGAVTIAMDRDNASGFLRFHDKLMDTSAAVPERVAKLYTIYSGRTPGGEPVFNSGNLYRTDWKPLKALLLGLKETATWDALKEELSSRGHRYRAEMANRHGHSNELPSYYAFGFGTLKEYYNMASEDEWKRYMAKHPGCCGVAQFVAEMAAAAVTS